MLPKTWSHILCYGLCGKHYVFLGPFNSPTFAIQNAEISKSILPQWTFSSFFFLAKYEAKDSNYMLWIEWDDFNYNKYFLFITCNETVRSLAFSCFPFCIIIIFSFYQNHFHNNAKENVGRRYHFRFLFGLEKVPFRIFFFNCFLSTSSTHRTTNMNSKRNSNWISWHFLFVYLHAYGWVKLNMSNVTTTCSLKISFTLLKKLSTKLMQNPQQSNWMFKLGIQHTTDSSGQPLKSSGSHWKI